MPTTKTPSLLTFRRPIPRRLYFKIAWASVFFCIFAWWCISYWQLFPESFFPSPIRVVATGYAMFTSGDFLTDVFASIARIGVAFLISALLAIPIGVLMSSFKSIEAILEPMIDFVRYVPVPALLPIFILWSGIGETSKFLVLFFGTFFQLVLLVMDDSDNVPRIYFDLASTLGARRAELICDILIPYMLPQIYDRLRVTLGWCWTYLVIAELIAVEKGIGHTIKEAQRFNAADQLFVCFIVLGIIGLLTDYCAKLAYRRLFPYAAKAALQAR